MDILSTSGMPSAVIAEAIKENEARWPSLRGDNDLIRGVPSHQIKIMLLWQPDLDVAAALISSCRSDMLNCGRCRFWNTYRKAGFSKKDLL
jgi:hypothetical protein